MIDAIILGVFFISVLVGWFRGAVKEVCSIISWVGSGYLAWKLFPVGLDIVREYISQPLLANIATGISLFIVFLIVLSLLTCLFSSLVQKSLFSIADKICGSIFGLVRGILIISVAEFVATYYVFKEPPAMFQQSITLPYVKNVSQSLFLLLPSNIQKELVSYLNKDKMKDLITAFGGKLDSSIFAKKTSDTTSEKSVVNSQNDTNKVEPSKSDRASELARLGVKKPEPNANINKSVRSDLDKLIDQYT